MAKLKVYERKKLAKELYQIHISMKWIKPKIWRRVLIPADMKLEDLHRVIQAVIGWTNSHLHQFAKDGQFYRKKMDDDFKWGYTGEIDYENIRVSDLISAEKDSMVYEYDFGDGWVHNILLEKIVPNNEGIINPVCLAGKRNCPPEDCGGPPGYEDILEALKHPDDEEYEELLEWVGEEYDPEEFNIEEVNEFLKKDNYGCLEL